jgi:hypothetical protein
VIRIGSDPFDFDGGSDSLDISVSGTDGASSLSDSPLACCALEDASSAVPFSCEEEVGLGSSNESGGRLRITVGSSSKSSSTADRAMDSRARSKMGLLGGGGAGWAFGSSIRAEAVMGLLRAGVGLPAPGLNIGPGPPMEKSADRSARRGSPARLSDERSESLELAITGLVRDIGSGESQNAASTEEGGGGRRLSVLV